MLTVAPPSKETSSVWPAASLRGDASPHAAPQRHQAASGHGQQVIVSRMCIQSACTRTCVHYYANGTALVTAKKARATTVGGLQSAGDRGCLLSLFLLLLFLLFLLFPLTLLHSLAHSSSHRAVVIPLGARPGRGRCRRRPVAPLRTCSA